MMRLISVKEENEKSILIAYQVVVELSINHNKLGSNLDVW